jgi:UDP-glucose 4-epimerase
LAANASLLVYGDGAQTRDFIYVGDVAQANLRALHADVIGVLNIATGRSVTLLDLIASMQSVTRRTLAVEHAPRPAGDIVHSAADNRRMREALGDFAFTPLADGLTQLLA